MSKQKKPKKQSKFWYGITKIPAWFVAKTTFKRKFIRNEIKGKKGPFVVIANHQAALDFVNLIGASRQMMTFVVSDSFYNTLSVKGIMDKIGVIPKQQFQTTLEDVRKMKSAIEQGKILVLYPAGLMCEDGLSTPIPKATYAFLKRLKADVYVARTSGTYFVTPKWSSFKRPGRTYLDIYKLFSSQEISELEVDEVKKRTDEAILFDAYRDQEKLLIKYKKAENIEGIENVLYMCPHCGAEFSVGVKEKSTIYCSECGFEQQSDEYGFLHKKSSVGEEIRYASDWSKHIYSKVKQDIKAQIIDTLSAEAEIQMINYGKRAFESVGRGEITLNSESFRIVGAIRGEDVDISIPIANFASLPFKPGKYLEIQHGKDIYRCMLDDGKLVMKFINMVKAYYELSDEMHNSLAAK